MIVKADDGNFYRDPIIRSDSGEYYLLFGDWKEDDYLLIRAAPRNKGEPRNAARPMFPPAEIIARLGLPVQRFQFIENKPWYSHLLGKKAQGVSAYKLTWKENAVLPAKIISSHRGVMDRLSLKEDCYLFCSPSDYPVCETHTVGQKTEIGERPVRPDGRPAKHVKLFVDFKAKIEAAGMQAIDHGSGHWQIRGGRLLVNYYPSKGTIYVDGTHSGRHGGWDEAIAAANTLPEIVPKHTRTELPDRSYKKKLRRYKWISQMGCCHWCKKPMVKPHRDPTPAELDLFPSIDHVIPVARNGNNGWNNLVLAHVKCNSDRGCDMPEFNRNNDANTDVGETDEDYDNGTVEVDFSGRAATGGVCPEHVGDRPAEVEGGDEGTHEGTPAN